MQMNFTHTNEVKRISKKIFADLYSNKVTKFVIGNAYFFLNDDNEVCFQTADFKIQFTTMSFVDVLQVVTVFEAFGTFEVIKL